MAKKRKFINELQWKFKPDTIILIPRVEIFPNFYNEFYVGTIVRYNVHGRSNVSYVLKHLITKEFTSMDKNYVEKYAEVPDNRTVKLLYGG